MRATSTPPLLAWTLAMAWVIVAALAHGAPDQPSSPGGLSPAAILSSAAADSGEVIGAQAEPGPDVYDEIQALRPPPATWEDRTLIARVGADTVTAGDLYYALDNGRAIDRSLSPDSLKQSLLHRVINQRLLIQEGYRRHYERTLHIKDFSQKIEYRLATEELRRRIYEGKIDVTESELQELYERQFYRLKVRHLSVERQDLAEDLLRRLQAGEDFGELAKRYSEDKKTADQGGDMGDVVAGRLVIHFEDEVFKLEPGQLTRVIKGKGEHYKIFKLESKVRDRKPTMTLEQLRAGLAARVRIRELGTVYGAWEDSLFDKYQVAINEDNFRVFSHRLRDQIANWEAVNSVKRDSLPQSWIFTEWPQEELVLELARLTKGRLLVGEFVKTYRDEKFCPTCLWRDSDIQLRQYVMGLVFDKMSEMEKRAILAENPPSLKREFQRRKEDRMSQMVAGSITVGAETVGDVEARAYWEEHKDEYKQFPLAKVRRIVVDSEDHAKDIVERLEGGADFAALAERFSKDETTNWRGGETDFFGPGSMHGMADIALQHPEGELIPPFKSKLGWEVVVVLEKRPAGVKTFEEVSGIVRNQVAGERTEIQLQNLLEELRGKTPITVDEANLAQMSLAS